MRPSKDTLAALEAGARAVEAIAQARRELLRIPPTAARPITPAPGVRELPVLKLSDVSFAAKARNWPPVSRQPEPPSKP